MEAISFSPLYPHAGSVYQLEGFRPSRVDATYLKQLGVRVSPSADTLKALMRGSEVFAQRLEAHRLIPGQRYFLDNLDPEQEKPEIHNYTGRCPTLTYEINPVKGCSVGCLYCLVSDGVHELPLIAHDNYELYVRRLLEQQNGIGSKNQEHYYYFSPKTEAFQEATLFTGIAHRILREFIDHYPRNPESKARLFIASKAGARHLRCEYEGESILDLFSRLGNKMQFNTSVSIMPDALRVLLEPCAAPIGERLAAVKLCREAGIPANSALVQPIFPPCLTDSEIRRFFDALHEAGIINYKPEFLTVGMENLAMLGQYLGFFDKDLERQLYEDYLLPSNEDHRKQRSRTAPDRKRSLEDIRRMMAYTDSIGMSTSICYWVRMQLGISEETIPLVNRNGFQCLGYQRKLFQ
ncbi:MAG: hypothetical protein J6P56_00685 [Bacteroidales bacterium]|nr:hypothetical protein [Bacteroidales bacterium]